MRSFAHTHSCPGGLSITGQVCHSLSMGFQVQYHIFHTYIAFCVADRTMYAVHPIPLSEVKAIRKHTPSFGWQYIVLVLVNGLTLPPLYFGTGGVRALFAALKQVRAISVWSHPAGDMQACCVLQADVWVLPV